jgi:ATP-binding cassette subfamily F protein uup
MAAPPLLTLTDITLGFGGDPLFTGLSLSVAAGERTCLVGRNGSGKSTLLKVMAGLVAPDEGERFVRPGAKIAYLPQEPDLSGFATLGDYVAADLDDAEGYVAEMAMEGLQVAAEADPATASGGEKRRAALARMIAAAPDLMLLDDHPDQPRPGVPAEALAPDPVAGPGRGAAAAEGVRRLRGLARQDL